MNIKLSSSNTWFLAFLYLLIFFSVLKEVPWTLLSLLSSSPTILNMVKQHPSLSFSLSFSLSEMFVFHAVGWNYLQMSLGRKIDPEPGRCRRTDGKKWRCSKEAYPDSKYCERHMHRGKNRSRKPVDVLKTTATNDLNHHSNPTFSSLKNNSSLLSYRPFPGHRISSTPNGNGISTKDTNTLLLLEPGSYSDRSPDYRFVEYSSLWS